MTAKRQRHVVLAAGTYYVATGVSPFVSRRLFEAVTGPKPEWWLVQVVGLLVTAVGAGAVSAARSDRVTPETVAVLAGCAASLTAVDVVYVARRRIKPTFLIDAAVEVGILGALAWARRGR